MTPLFFNHNTPGAPLLTGGTNANLTAVLKFCLIQIGWTLVWEDATARKACFRNDPVAGNGCYLYIDETTNAQANMDIAEEWDDTNKVLINPAGPSTLGSRGTYKGASADNRQWWLVGDNRTFYMQISGKFVGQAAETTDGSVSNWYQWPFGAGDYNRFDGKPGVFLSCTYGTSATIPSQSNCAIGYTGYGYPDMNIVAVGTTVTRGADGSIQTGVRANLCPGTYSSPYTTGNGDPLVTPDTTQLLFQQCPPLYTSNGNSLTMGVTGVFRGVWMPIFRVATTCPGMYLDETWRAFGNNQFTELLLWTGKISNASSSVWTLGIEKGRPW